MDSFPIDYHLHTKWCEHASGEMRDYVERAIELGLNEVGFAVHMPVKDQPHEKDSLTEREVEKYASEIEKLRGEYASGIKIRMGAEFDYYREKPSKIERYIAAYDFDYLYGSVHDIDGWLFDWLEYAAEGWEKFGVEKVYEKYFKLLVKVVECGLFDILSHFDLIKKFGQRPAGSVLPLAEPLLAAAAAAGMVLEVNSSGWRFPCAELYPSSEILVSWRQRGGEITFGSDAHCPEDVGRDSARALQVARQAGFDQCVVFEKRQRKIVKF